MSRCVGTIDTAVKGTFSNTQHSTKNLLDALNTTRTALCVQVMLFTYTDKDGFVPPSDKADGGVGGRGRFTTGDGRSRSFLEEAVTNMPRKAATSSVEASAAASGAGGEARAGVSETAAVIQTHLAREDKFKVRSTACCRALNVQVFCSK